ncbi:holo-[acyl-carrier-protein] synthase [Thermotoga sp. SG1]|uniref:holo-[acyl-carrier-protein] synthase n=1 Tax=Thermotoga sp. SG1 TaxID=126739 RepID=UPI000C781278|nr:holo-[acyl-carrier-protein] synthase [Thermotoga sp. SG1]PLV56810.1 4'-phosphopantetheinyl transferase [Thermotoga sp. SG1]
MIVGVGVDFLEIERVSERLAERVLGEDEKNIFRSRRNKKEFVAGRFALKEAFFKALGTGLNGYRFTDVEFLESGGKPVVKIHRDFGEFNFVHVSLSHDRFVVAVVVLEKRKGGIIVEGDEKVLRENFCVLGKSAEGWEIDTLIPPFSLKKRLSELHCQLVRYGNILLSECEIDGRG